MRYTLFFPVLLLTLLATSHAQTHLNDRSRPPLPSLERIISNDELPASLASPSSTAFPSSAGRPSPPSRTLASAAVCNKTCSHEFITCEHGCFNDPCRAHMHSGHGFMRWGPQFKCDCNAGGSSSQDWTGVSCSIARRNESCQATPKTPHLDALFENTQADEKYIECEAVEEGQKLLQMDDHRINVSYSRSQGTLSFTVLTRVWNATWDGPHHRRWGPLLIAIQLNLAECTAKTVPDDPDHQIQYKCMKIASSQFCGAAEGCSGILGIITHATPPVYLYGSDVGWNGTGTARMTLMNNVIPIKMTCKTGSCQSVAAESNTQPYVSYRWVIYVVVSLGALMCVFVSSCAFYANRRSRKFMFKRTLSGNRFERTNSAERDSDDDDDGTYTLRRRRPAKTSNGESYQALEDPGREPPHHSAPVRTVELAFYNICYDIGPRRILNNVSGLARSGEVVALLGLSGAGKTTLLDILARRRKVGVVSGGVALYLNGSRVRSRSDRLADFVSYMPAESRLLSTQSVYEAVLFSARLRLPQNTPEKQLHVRVMNVLEDLGLAGIAHSQIGDHNHGGISTGERKRVAIAVELVADPLVLFLDEPTSGLDSYNTALFIKVITDAARRRGLLCLFSVHQPPSDVFDMFDKILLLTRFGEPAYYGEAELAMQYMADVAGHACHKRYVNPPEFLLELSANTDTEMVRDLHRRFVASPQSRELQDRIAELCDFETSSEMGKFKNLAPSQTSPGQPGSLARVDSSDKRESEASDFSEATALSHVTANHNGNAAQPLLISDPSATPRLDSGPRASMLAQVVALSLRSFVHIARKPSLLLLTIAFNVLAALILGFVFYKVENNTGGVQDRAGFLFFIVFFFSLINISAIPQFVEEHSVFLRERRDNYYSTLPYALSKFVSDLLPMRVMPPVVFCSISYWLVGLKSEPFAFTTFVTIVILVNVVATSTCFLITALVSEPTSATLCTIVVIVFNMLFGGIFLNGNEGTSTVDVVSKIRYVSYFHYAYDALMLNEFDGRDLFFDLYGNKGGHIGGGTFLNILSVEDDNFGVDVAALTGFAVVLFTLGFLSLKYVKLGRT